MAKKIIRSVIVLLLALTLVAVAAKGQIVDEEVTFQFEGGATLTLHGVVGEVTATGVPTYNYPPLPPLDEIPLPEIQSQITAFTADETSEDPAWDIRVTGSFEYGRVGLPWTETPIGELWQIDIVIGDVNYDGIVDCKDIRMILRAFGSSPDSRICFLQKRWNSVCDLNEDGKVNFRDLCIAFSNYGETAEWEPLDNIYVDYGLQMIFGDTDNFSIFRGR